MQDTLKQVSRRMSSLLRHRAGTPSSTAFPWSPAKRAPCEHERTHRRNKLSTRSSVATPTSPPPSSNMRQNLLMPCTRDLAARAPPAWFSCLSNSTKRPRRSPDMAHRHHGGDPGSARRGRAGSCPPSWHHQPGGRRSSAGAATRTALPRATASGSSGRGSYRSRPRRGTRGPPWAKT